MKKFLKKYVFLIISIILFISLVFVINYLLDLNKDYNHLKKQFIKEKQNYVFLGDSITYGYPLDEFYDDQYVVNSGINGNSTNDILDDLDNRVYKYNPTKVFLQIGINDMKDQKSSKKILYNIDKIIQKIQKNRPYAKIYVLSLYPLSKKPDFKAFRKVSNTSIINLNKELKKISDKYNVTYINVYDSLTDDKGYFKGKYTYDGVHPNGLGYYKITKVLKKYVEEQI